MQACNNSSRLAVFNANIKTIQTVLDHHHFQGLTWIHISPQHLVGIPHAKQQRANPRSFLHKVEGPVIFESLLLSLRCVDYAVHGGFQRDE